MTLKKILGKDDKNGVRETVTTKKDDDGNIIETVVKKVPEKVIGVSKVVSATLVIIGAVTALFTWLDNHFAESVSTQISAMHEEMTAANEKTDRQITRLELLNLIQNQPNNKVEIEKVAKHYFIDLGGDWYASAFYSEWAANYGGNAKLLPEED